MILKYNDPVKDQGASSACPVRSWRVKGKNAYTFWPLERRTAMRRPFSHEMGRSLEQNRPLLQQPMANVAIFYPHSADIHYTNFSIYIYAYDTFCYILHEYSQVCVIKQKIWSMHFLLYTYLKNFLLFYNFSFKCWFKKLFSQ